MRVDEFLRAAPLGCGDHVDQTARSDPAGVRWSPLGQGPHSPPNPVLSVMLPRPVSGLLGEMTR